MAVIQNVMPLQTLSASVVNNNTSTPLKKTPFIDAIKKDELVSSVASPAGISPPDDVIGDVMPFSLFPLVDGNHFEQDINNIAHIVKTLPKYDAKIQISNKIPTGIVKIEKL